MTKLLYTWDNPICLKEMRLCARDKWIKIGFSSLLAIGMLICVGIILRSPAPLDQFRSRGESILISLFWFQAITITFLAPSLSASSIARERQCHTMDSLLSSHLSPLHIVVGKAEYSLCMIGLFLIMVLPLEATAFFFGGATVISALKNKLLLIGLAAVLTATSLQSSAKATASAKATLSSFASSGFIGVGILGWFVMLQEAGNGSLTEPVLFLTFLFMTSDALLTAATAVEERAEYKIWQGYLSLFVLFFASATLTALTLVDPTPWAKAWRAVIGLISIALSASFTPIRYKKPTVQAKLESHIFARPWFSIVFFSLVAAPPFLLYDPSPLTANLWFYWISFLALGVFSRGWAFESKNVFNGIYISLGLCLLLVPLFLIDGRKELGTDLWSVDLLSPIRLTDGFVRGALQTIPPIVWAVYGSLFLVGLVGFGVQKLFKVKR